MTRRRRWLLLVLVVLVLLTGATRARVYLVWEQGGAELIWNSRSATVFIDRQRLGWSANYVQWIWEWLRELLGGSSPAPARLQWQTILTISAGRAGPSYAVREQTSTAIFHPRGVVDGAIVGSVERTGRLWDGDQAVPLTEAQQQRFSTANPLSSPADTAATGWRRQRNLLNGGEGVFTLHLQNTTIELIARRSGFTDQELLIRLPSQEPRRIWSLDARPRYVSAAEFATLMTSPR